MRDAVETLRKRADNFRFVGRSESHREAALEADRAADLLEALSNPPETVEELRERLVELTDETVWIEESNGYCEVRLPVIEEHMCMEFRSTERGIRAAWFAIVGMEVGRGD